MSGAGPELALDTGASIDAQQPGTLTVGTSAETTILESPDLNTVKISSPQRAAQLEEGRAKYRQEMSPSKKALTSQDTSALEKNLVKSLQGNFDDLHNPAETDIREYAKVILSDKFSEALQQTDTNGVEMGVHLERLLNDKLDDKVVSAFKDRYPKDTEKMIKAEILKSILEKIDTGMGVDQGTKNTCAIAAAEMTAFNIEIAETTAAAVNLVTDGHHQLAGGERLGLSKSEATMTLAASAIGRDLAKGIYPERGILDQVLQESGSKWLAEMTAKGHYDPGTTSWKSGNKTLSGFFAPQSNLFLEALTNRSFTHISVEDNPERKAEVIQEIERRLPVISSKKDLKNIDFTKAIQAHTRWSEQGDHARHSLNAVAIMEIDGEKYVILANSHYKKGFGPKDLKQIFQSGENKIHQRLEAIPLDEFNDRLCDVHLLEYQGDTELTSDLQKVKNYVSEQTVSRYMPVKRIKLQQKKEEKTVPVSFVTMSIDFEDRGSPEAATTESVLETDAAGTTAESNQHSLGAAYEHELRMRGLTLSQEAAERANGESANTVTLSPAPGQKEEREVGVSAFNPLLNRADSKVKVS